MLLKCCTQYASKFGKLNNGHRTGKCQFSFQSQRRAMLKNVQTNTIAFISHASKVMLKILQVRLQQYVKQELPDVQAGFRKGRGTRGQIATPAGSSKMQESSRKISTSALLTMPKPLTVWITANYGKFLKKWEYQTTLPASWEICTQVKKQQLEPNMEQWTGSKLGKEYVKAVYCHPAYLTSMQSTSWRNAGLEEAQAGIKIAGRNINNLRYTDNTTLWQKVKKN